MVSIPHEKITITIPTHIKEDVAKLKDDLKVSMNSIYQNAIHEYVKQKNREKLRAEALQMVDEYKNNPEMIELSHFEEEIVEY